jgi:arsenite-transporting ATPase
LRTILFTGKGGVGKTTLAAATALHSAALGHRTLVISTDIAHSLADALALPLGNDPRPVGSNGLYAAELDSGAELEEYWGDVKRRIAAALRNEGIEATTAGELAILPGLDEVLALVRIKRYYDEGLYDTLVIDSAPTGAAMRLLAAPDLNRWYTRSLLNLPRGLSRMILPAVRSLVRLPITEDVVEQRIGQLFDQVEALRAILTDAEQTSVRLVLNPDQLAVRETQRAFTYMNLFGLAVDALFVNRVLPEGVADPFFADWKVDQSAHRAQVRELFAPLPVYEVPLMRQAVVGLDALNDLGAQLYGGADPVPRLSAEQPLRFYLENGRYVLALRVAGVAAGTVDLEKRGDELRVRLGSFRRVLALPQYLAGLQPAWARLEGQDLLIAFEEPTA